MRQATDCYTLELIPAAVKRGRGRPRKDDALSDADRARRYRARLKAKASKPVSAGHWRVCLDGTSPAWACGYYILNCSVRPPSFRRVMGGIKYGGEFSQPSSTFFDPVTTS